MKPETTSGYESAVEITEKDIHFECNDDLVLATRLRDPEIYEQLVNLKFELQQADDSHYKNEEWEPYMPEGWNGEERFTLMRGKQSGTIIDTDALQEKITQPAPTLASAAADVNRVIEETETITHVDFSTNEPSADRMGLNWTMPWTNTKPTAKQMSIINAHEKGHRIRDFYDAYTDRLKGGFDLSHVRFTEQDREFIKQSQDQSDTEIIDDEDESLEAYGQRYLEDYLFSGVEIAERMSQLKNYFGFISNEQFTKQHLDYAREHYIKDTGLDNSMRLFFEAITPETEASFLELINNSGI